MRRDIRIQLRALGPLVPADGRRDQRQRPDPLGVFEGEVECDLASHAQPHEPGGLEAESVQDRQQVVFIAKRRGRRRRASMTPGVVTNHSVVPCQRGEDAVPQAAVVDRSVEQDQRGAVPSPLGPDVASAGDGDQLGRHTPDSITPPLSTAHPPAALSHPTKRTSQPCRTSKVESAFTRPPFRLRRCSGRWRDDHHDHTDPADGTCADCSAALQPGPDSATTAATSAANLRCQGLYDNSWWGFCDRCGGHGGGDYGNACLCVSGVVQVPASYPGAVPAR